MVAGLLQLVLLTAGLVLACGLIGVLAGFFAGSIRAPWSRRRRADRPVHRPLEQVAADLRRLARQLVMVPAGAPQARRRGLQAAYDDVLIEAAALLEVPHQLATSAPDAAIERRRVQQVLAEAGLDPR